MRRCAFNLIRRSGALIVVGVLGLAGCDFANPSDPGRSGEPLEIKVVGKDFSFSPGSIEVPLNRKVTFVFENQGDMPHDWVIEGSDLHLVANPGTSARREVTFEKQGTYAIVCSIPGHKEYGMAGTLWVGTAATKQETSGSSLKPLPGNLSRLPLPQVAPRITRTVPGKVTVELEAREVTALMADGVAFTYWTFDGTVPGPMLRVRQGDEVELTLRNALSSKLTHSIDLHAVTGPGGGAKDTQVAPGGRSTILFKALNPGVYVYHCATPKVAHHIANGLYGLIVVEPAQGLLAVDREFYVMQGEFYLQGQRGEPGWHDSSWPELLEEAPDYVVLNGSVGALSGANSLEAKVGETVRIFFGVGGPNLTSSFHVIGEIFDRVYPEGASEAKSNLQTTLVPAGGATVVELKLEVPGTYTLVDHSLGRLDKGAAGSLVVEGAANPDAYTPVGSEAGAGADHSSH